MEEYDGDMDLDIYDDGDLLGRDRDDLFVEATDRKTLRKDSGSDEEMR